MTRTLLSLAALVFSSVILPGQTGRLTLAHLEKIVKLTAVEVSPDGKWIAVVTSRANYEENRFDTDLLLLNPANGEQRLLTHDRLAVKSPKWSPAGDRLAFLADSSGKTQLYVMPVNGGEAMQVTKSPTAVAGFSWQPNGAAFAYTAAAEPGKKSGIARHNKSFEAGMDSILTQAAPESKHIWLITAEGGVTRQLTSGDGSVGAGDLAWSPDGQQLAYVRFSSAHTGDARDSSIYLLDVAGGQSRPLTGRSRQRESSPRFSTDGKFIAYDYPSRGPYHPLETLLSPVGGGEGRTLTRALDRNTQLVDWTHHGQAVVISGNDGTASGLWIQPLEAGPAQRVDIGTGVALAGTAAVSVGPRGEFALALASASNPGELFWKPSASAPLTQLTHFNEEFGKLALGRSERVTWSSDTYALDGVVTYPPDFRPAAKYPLVLDIHGGPTSASRQGFSARPQLLAAQGWVVFEPNYRGSDNLGDTVQSGILNDAGEGPGRDIMRGIDELKKRGWVDATRIGVGGWSYGGYMTAWLMGHYPGVWKAAITGAAAVDRMDSYNLSDMNVTFGPMLGGSPWTAGMTAKYRAHSAIEYVDRMQTPTLILHNTRDERVSITNGYKLYHALSDLGVPVKFVAYPVAGHSAPDPVHQQDVLRRWVDWFQGYLQDPAATQ